MLKNLLINFLNTKQFIRGNINRNDNLGALHKAWGYVFTNQLYGSYYEFGVYEGNSMINSYLEFLELYPKSIYYDDIRLRLRELASLVTNI